MPLISGEQSLFFAPELIDDVNAQREIGISLNMDDRIVGINPTIDFNLFIFFFSADPDHAFFKIQGLGEFFFSQYIWAEPHGYFPNLQKSANLRMAICF